LYYFKISALDKYNLLGAIMKKIIAGILTLFLFLGCSSKETNEQAVEPKLVINKSLESLQLNDQFEKPHALTANTQKIIFAFSKDVGHMCNDFFATKKDTYLSDNNALFVADISGAPSLIRTMFIVPGLKDFKHDVLVIDDKQISSEYKPAQNSEKIVVVELADKIITDIKYLNSTEELSLELENK
jgi:hypothetical protein